MPLKKEKQKTPKLVETTCNCPAEIAGAPPDSDSPIDVSASATTKRSPRMPPVIRNVVVGGIAAVLVAMLCRTAVNAWLDQPSVRIGRNKDRLSWCERARNMSPLEAWLTQSQLVLRIGAQRSPIVNAIRTPLKSKYETRDWWESADADLLRLALLESARNQDSEAIAAMEQSMLIPDLNLGEGEGRWTFLLQLYLKQGQYQKAAALVEKVSALPGVRSAYGDRVQFHSMAYDVYSKAGWTEKASQEKRQSDLDKFTPSQFQASESSRKQLVSLRNLEFQQAWHLLNHEQPGEALPVLDSLLSEDDALRDRIDSPEFVAALRMMVPIAQTQLKNWTDAEKNFPAALRLAAAEARLPSGHGDVKPALYRAYAQLLDHQGKSSEAELYRQKSADASNFSKLPYFIQDVAKHKYDQNDLYPPDSN